MELTDIAYGQEISLVPRTFAYVSTVGQTTENQIQEIKAAGFTVSARRVISETVSDSSAIEQRPAFMRLLDKLEQADRHQTGQVGQERDRRRHHGRQAG